MQTKQVKSNNASTTTKTAETAQKADIKAGGATRVPVWANAQSNPINLQTKLTINQPGDIYEQEADRVAEHIMSMSAMNATSPTHIHDETIMRKGASSEIGSTQSAPPIVNQVLSSSGQLLDSGTKAMMEPHFGQDFGDVRVHTNQQAAESAQVVNARAYTVGSDVVFGKGEYQPGTSEGQGLLAHELTHVVQQSSQANYLQRSPHTNLLPRKDDDAKAQQATQESEITFEDDVITNVADQVIEQPPSFQDGLVLILPGNHYVKVQSHRYAITANIGRATKWARTLFGTTASVIVDKVGSHNELIYYVASLDEPVKEADLHVVQSGGAPRVPGESGRFEGKVLGELFKTYNVVAVLFSGGGFSAPTQAAFTQFVLEKQQANKEGSSALPPELVHKTVFQPIDDLLAKNDSESLEKATGLLAELTADAFSTLDWQTRAKYIDALVRAWTSQPQEIAIVEIIKSVGNLTELRAIFTTLRNEKKIWDQLFADMDSELWSMLITIGQRFGDPNPLSFESLVKFLLEARLITITPGVVLGPDGKPEISLDVIAEIQEAARSFIRFLGGILEGIKMLITHPDKIVEGVGQLLKMCVMVELAKIGYEPAQKTIEQVLTQMGQQVIFGLKGVAITGMGPTIMRRIMWAVIWEVASWFIGIGEIKAAVEGLGISEKFAAIAHFLEVLGLIGKAAEEEKIVSKLEILAQILSKSSKVVTKDEEVLRLLGHLPEKDIKRLALALEKVEVDETMTLARLAQMHPELGEVATTSLKKAEVLSQFASKAGGLTDEVVEAFGRLASGGRLEVKDVADVVKHIPQGEGARFARAIRGLPEAAIGEEVSTEFLRMVAGNSKRMDALINIGYGSFRAIYSRAGSNAQLLEHYVDALSAIEQRMPVGTRATEYRKLLDRLEQGDPHALFDVEEEVRKGAGKADLVKSLKAQTADWAQSFKRSQARGREPSLGYQIKQCGIEEVDIPVPGTNRTVRADGLIPEEGMIRDAKFVENPKQSPYVDPTKIDDPPRSFIVQSINDEFARYSTVINDPNSPVVGLELVTNEPLAKPHLEQLLRNHNIPGRVVVR